MSVTARVQPNSSTSGAEQRHHAQEHVPAGLGHTKELIEGGVRLAEHVAQRTAEADHGVEGGVWETA